MKQIFKEAEVLYDMYTGSFTVGDALIKIASRIGSNVFPDYKAAIKFFTNFVENMKLALGGNLTVGRIMRILPDFASMLVSIIPGARVAGVFADLYGIATIL